MVQRIEIPASTIFRQLVLSIVFVLAAFLWQSTSGFNLWDEGFLWYGVQRVMMGEVPIRDFSAYDPARYYWSAALMSLWGDSGIMALRGVVAIFQTFGLFLGLLLVARSGKERNFYYSLLSAVTCIVWMFPRHKLFDISLSICLISALTFLIQNPNSRYYFFTGFCVGVVAFFGRNHGLYGIFGSIGVMLWLNIGRLEGTGLYRGFVFWIAGVTVGFSPMIFMALLVPGYASAFLESIRYLFELKATNIPLPAPWPWRVNFAEMPLGEAIRGVLVGLFFMGTVVFGVLSLVWVIRQKIQNKHTSPALVAASFLALPYAHYAFSRADIGHLALGIFPLLIGCLALLASQPAKVKWPLALMLCAASLWVMCVFHPGWQCRILKQCVSIEVSGDKLLVHPSTASDVALLRSLAGQYAQDDQSFIATPSWPGAYALLERKSPIWEIYALLPRSPSFEQREIERIVAAKPGFALVFDLPLDGHDELRYRHTHPLTNQYIVDNFERLPDSPNPAYQIYRKKWNTQ